MSVLGQSKCRVNKKKFKGQKSVDSCFGDMFFSLLLLLTSSNFLKLGNTSYVEVLMTLDFSSSTYCVPSAQFLLGSFSIC